MVRVAAEPTEVRASWVELGKVHGSARPDAQPTVSASFATLDEAGQRAQLHDRYATVTARLQVDDKGGGKFVADGKLVAGFTLLLEPAQLGKDGACEVRWQNKPVKKTAKPDVAVLLREFAERFDRTFLPVAQVQVP